MGESVLRQTECEYRPRSIRFLEADGATVLFSYPTSQSEPQAYSVGLFCSHERIEQRPPDRGRYTGTIVQDCDVDPFIDFRNVDLYFRHVS
jgi:hypothetical protein